MVHGWGRQEVVGAGRKAREETGEAQAVLQDLCVFFRLKFSGREARLRKQQPELVGRPSVPVSNTRRVVAGRSPDEDDGEIWGENVRQVVPLRWFLYAVSCAWGSYHLLYRRD